MRWNTFSADQATLSVVLGFTLLLGGCASRPPERFIDGVPFIAEQQQVRDAKVQRVTGWPCLRVEPALLAELDAAMAEEELPKAREAATRFLEGAHELALASTAGEMDRLDDEGWQQVIDGYFRSGRPADAETRELVKQEFRRQTDVQVWFLKRDIAAAQSAGELRQVLAPIREAVEPAVEQSGRFERAAPLVLLRPLAEIGRASVQAQDHHILDHPFEAAVWYTPPAEAPAPAEPTMAKDWELLVRFAPRIVQEHPAQVKYPRDSDRIGEVTALDNGTVRIDVSRPTVYAYARRVRIAGREYAQLTYTQWYPEHPQINGQSDPEAGDIEGVCMRVTLDAQARPVMFETVHACGCYHEVYPTIRLEHAAARQYGEPEKDKRFAVEHDAPERLDLVVPEVVDQDAGQRPVVRFAAGLHRAIDVDMRDAQHANEPVAERTTYTLRHYDELERLRTPGGKIVSMFLDNGLVRGAGRLEGALCAPLGMLSAGQPRQRGTMLLHWDQYDFDDPKLFETALRWPDDF